MAKPRFTGQTQTRETKRQPPADAFDPPAARVMGLQPDTIPYSKWGSQLPCASIRSSHIATILSMGSSLEVCGSTIAA